MKTRRVTKTRRFTSKTDKNQKIYMQNKRLSEGVIQNKTFTWEPDDYQKVSPKKQHLFNDMSRWKPDVYQQESQNKQNMFMNNL